MRAPVALLGIVVLLGCDDPPSPPAPDPTPPPVASLDLDDPSACAPCHATIVEEWQSSMHAQAHHGRDPIYGAMRRLRMEREGDELAQRCAQCHGPRDPDNPESAVAATGVSCAGCHAIAALEGPRRGARGITYGDGLRGPHDHDDTTAAPHGLGPAAPWITDGRTLCLTCHDAMANPSGAPTCTTGPEHRASDSAQTCVDCHMPALETRAGAVDPDGSHRSHAFLGPHQLYRENSEGTFLATALDATLVLEGTELRMTVDNRAGHAVPSGFPGRVVIALAVGFDASGEEVWRSFREEPMRETPDAVFNKVYVDADGTPTLPPYAERVSRDTRLSPGETRVVRWSVPEAVSRAEVRMLYRLLPPPAATRLGIADHPHAQPRPFMRVSTSGTGS